LPLVERLNVMREAIEAQLDLEQLQRDREADEAEKASILDDLETIREDEEEE
jgi:hypothetical protein